jgi:superfamily II DNA or RNA helicase
MYAAGMKAACASYGYKEARHAVDRLQERTQLGTDVIPQLDAEADRLTDHVAPGHYYLPLKNEAGVHVGYAAFKTVEDYPKPRLVLATILGPDMKPKGTSLSDRMQHPNVMQKMADELANNTELHQRFQELAHLLRRRGVYAGTGHKRIVVPKNKLTENDVKDLGFESVMVAIPEAGQDRFQSYRHPDNRFHLHSHPEGWTMHEDRHPAATMIARKAQTPLETFKAYVKGVPHVVTEGIPGLTYYLKGRISGRDSTARTVNEFLRPDVKARIQALPDSRNYLREQVKEARLKTELQPHQQRVVDRMSDPDQRGLVVHHGLGSGKTLTSIAVADKLKLPADVVTPAALQENYSKEVAKHTTTKPDMLQQSLENVARKRGNTLKRPLLVVDEAHRTRNPSQTQAALMRSPAEKRLLLTGSLLYNQPADIAGPINLVAGESTLPSNPADFDRFFVQQVQKDPGFFRRLLGAKPTVETRINPQTKPYLRDILKKYVDYHPSSTTDFPERKDQTIRVPMAAKQREIYDAILGKAPQWVQDKVRNGMPPTKAETMQLNSFLTGSRQVANTTAPFKTKEPQYSPKIDAALQELRKTLDANPRAKAVVYSNYLDAGIKPYREKLKAMGTPFGEFTGEMPHAQRDQLVRDYNENKIRALLLSSAGGEGLDLKGTRLMQILEPHWNEEKLKQVTGRGIRYKSHADLPEEERNVTVQRFLSTLPRKGLAERLYLKRPGQSVDEYLHGLAHDKERLNSQFKQLLTEDS